jgi:glycosyltransferase involved in cell wall biosynthesis
LFLCPATFARHKGQLALLRAVAELLADGKKIRVVLTGGGTDRIAGETPETDPRLEAVRCFYREHRASLEGAVELLGYCPVERVASLFREASAVVLPSEYEGFGLPLIEAASCGVPVLCTGIGPFVEQIERHDLGSVVRRFEPGDHRALAREMADVAEGRGPRRLPREELAAKLGKWTWDDCADAVVRVLDGIGRHRGNAGGRG